MDLNAAASSLSGKELKVAIVNVSFFSISTWTHLSIIQSLTIF